jgi:FtsZ-binding cell division protein ZapB
LNGKAFQGLNQLTHVYLHTNPCINENFETPLRIAALQQIVSANCRFDEHLMVENSKFKEEINAILAQLKSLMTENTNCFVNMEELRNNLLLKVQEIGVLNDKLQLTQAEVIDLKNKNNNLKRKIVNLLGVN